MIVNNQHQNLILNFKFSLSKHKNLQMEIIKLMEAETNLKRKLHKRKEMK